MKYRRTLNTAGLHHHIWVLSDPILCLSPVPHFSVCFILFLAFLQVSTSSWTVTFPRRTSGSVKLHWSLRWQKQPMRRRWRGSGITRSAFTSFYCLWRIFSIPDEPPVIFITNVLEALRSTCGFYFSTNFKMSDMDSGFQYPDMAKTMGEFSLEIKGGEFTDSEIMVMLGENGELPARFWTLN